MYLWELNGYSSLLLCFSFVQVDFKELLHSFTVWDLTQLGLCNLGLESDFKLLVIVGFLETKSCESFGCFHERDDRCLNGIDI